MNAQLLLPSRTVRRTVPRIAFPHIDAAALAVMVVGSVLLAVAGTIAVAGIAVAGAALVVCAIAHPFLTALGVFAGLVAII